MKSNISDKERRLILLMADILRKNPYTDGTDRKDLNYQINLVEEEWNASEPEDDIEQARRLR